MKINKTLSIWAVLLVTTLSATIARADNIDPATLHFGTGFGTSCYAGCAGDPNKILGTGFDIYQTSDSQSVDLGLSSINPLLLFISVPNTMPATISSTAISGVTFYPNATSSSGKTSGNYSAAGNSSTIFAVSPYTYNFSNPGFNSGSVYTFLHLIPQTDSSNNFNNYTLPGNDPSATSFTIYVFDIYGGTLQPNGLIQINFSTPLPVGSITAAYTQSTLNGKNYDNAFTEAGIVATTTSPVPEPSSMLLLCSGLTGMKALRRRRSKSA